MIASIAGFSTGLFTTSGVDVTVGSIVLFVATLVLAVLIGMVARRASVRSLSQRRGIDAGVAYAIGRAAQYAVVTGGAIVAFQFLGIDFSRLGLIVGPLSVGVGFGLQNVTSNFISGILLLLERPVTIGDRVSIGATEGDIEAINIRSTIVRSLENVAIVAPNSELITNNLINWSLGDPRIRLSVPVGVSYGSDVEAVRAALEAVAASHVEVLADPPPHIRLNGFGDSAWEMELLVWIDHPNRWRDVRSELNFAIVDEFRRRDVEIPFPQRDLHLRSGVPGGSTGG